MQRDMNRVRVFVFRSINYWGVGLSPEEAIRCAIRAGATKKIVHDSTARVTALPAGIEGWRVNYGGSLSWEGGATGFAEPGDLTEWRFEASRSLWIRTLGAKEIADHRLPEDFDKRIST